MPEMYFEVQFPDGRAERCYSPSLIIRELLVEGTEYPNYEFMARTRAALIIASERVKTKYGFYCSAAMDQLARLEELSASLEPTATVRVISFAEKGK
jgi:uncharacterized repeat protein (TIGR04042 family)